jgi:hypothetical protein
MDEKNIAAAFRRRLNSHGYAFQQAVLRHINLLSVGEPLTQIRFEAAEFPIELNGKHSHVDFILRFGEHYLVAECKRADPAVAVWCFAETPYVRPGRGVGGPVFSAPTIFSEATIDDMPHVIRTERPVYQIAAELRTGEKGDGVFSSGRAAIDDAVTQVSRSAGGWIERLVAEKNRLLRSTPTLIVPVVFTTAKLFTTDADLASADIKTGDLAELSVKPVTWLWFQAHLTRDLLPKQLRPNPVHDLGTPGDLLLTRHTRSVAIVNVDGIHPFLEFLQIENLFLERI